MMTDSSSRSRLQEELHQAYPFRSLSHEVMVSIARTACRMEREISSLLGPFGLSSAQYNVLRILRGSHPEALPTLAIRERMVFPAAAITRLVEKLERAGLLERERATSDRRQVRCRITASGLTMLDELEPMIAEVSDRLAAIMEVAELEQLSDGLDRVRTVFP